MVATSPGRRWLFRLTALVLLPALLLGGLEIGLRIAGYGYPTGFFKSIRIGNEDFLVENDKFGLRFFPPALARSPAPVLMTAKKPAGTYRIFLLGESAALGDPRPAFGAGRYLQALLRERFPDEQFEVVCVAVTAINSHVILPIARECAKHDGDFWIIYMGNNEMVGPFGAATVFGSQAPPMSFVRLSLALQRSRTGQLLTSIGRKLKGEESEKAWGGMKMFLENQVPPGDLRKEVVYDNFRRNLEDILRAGLDARAQVILSTVAVNLKDSPPFASMLSTNLSKTDHASFDQLSAAASIAEQNSKPTEAARLWEEAAQLGAKSAEVEFRLGQCLLGSTNYAAAREHFEKARDFDALPFRADSRINEIIEEVGQPASGRDLRLFDAAQVMASNSPTRIPGAESFYEHVHLNFDGNYLLARAWAEELTQFLPATLTNHAAADWASQTTCERRLGLTDWNRYAVIEGIILRLSQAPFTNRSNNDSQLADYRQKLDDLRKRMDDHATESAREIYTEALERTPTDYWLHENFAEFLELTGDLDRAIAEWETVRGLIPHHHVAHFQVGRLFAQQGKLAEAEPPLQRAVSLRPDLGEGWFELGKLHAAEENLDLAMQEFNRARHFLPRDHRIPYHIGRLFSKLNRRSEAIMSFRTAIQLMPNDWRAHYSLGEELAFAGQDSLAKREFEEAIRIQPEYDMAHFNLGVALFKEGQIENARQQFEETLRLNPEHKLASNYLRKLEQLQNTAP